MAGASTPGTSGPGTRGGGAHPGSSPESRDLWPRDFGRDGVSGLLTLDRAMRSRDVSRPTPEDERVAEEIIGELLARVDGRRHHPSTRNR